MGPSSPGPLDRAAAFLTNVRGVRRGVIAVASGVVGTLAFAPFYLFPALLLSYAVLVLLLDGAAKSPRPLRAGAATGWMFGFGFFFAGLYWVGYAFLVDAEEHAWMLPFLAVILPGGLALFFAAAGAVCAKLWRPNWQRAFMFATAFFAADWLRGHVLTGFPWHLPGYGWGALLSVLQATSIIGVYGLSLLTFLFGASLALVFDKPRRPAFAIALTLLFIAFAGYGNWRLGEDEHRVVAGPILRIVQPDTSQREKYKPEFVARNWRRLLDLSRARSVRPITHIVWPEAAPPIWWIARDPVALSDIRELLGGNKVLLTGVTRLTFEAGEPRYYNSFYVFGPGARILATYDKFHLVPFGEYLPFESALKSLGFSQVAGGSSSFSEGPGPQTLAAPGVPPFGPLICYEIIFPRAVVGEVRPQWLLNLTDDSWFGPDAGPEQHLLIARVRAIEEGLPVVRAANSGISGVIDAYGEMNARLDLDRRAFVDVSLPVALSETIFVRAGTWILVLMFFTSLGAALWPPRTRSLSIS